MENYDASGEATSGTKKIPCMPLVPANVGRKVIKGEMTPWEVVLLLNKTTKDKTQALGPPEPCDGMGAASMLQNREGKQTHGAPNEHSATSEPCRGTPHAGSGEHHTGGMGRHGSGASATSNVSDTTSCTSSSRPLCGGTSHSGGDATKPGRGAATAGRLERGPHRRLRKRG